MYKHRGGFPEGQSPIVLDTLDVKYDERWVWQHLEREREREREIFVDRRKKIHFLNVDYGMQILRVVLRT